MAWTLATYTLGHVQKMRVRYHSKATIDPTPDSGRNVCFVYDDNGVVNYITIEGILKDDTLANLRTMISNLRGLHTGSQYSASALSFVDDFMGETLNVFFETFDWVADVDHPTSVSYVITLVERVSGAE